MIARVMLFFMSVMFVIPSATAQVVTLPDIDISGSSNGIVPFPENTPAVFKDLFSKYTKIIAPNGKPIHFLIQNAWSDDKILKARNVMEHFLTDYPYSQYGSTKASVANAMSDRKSTMTLFNTSVDSRAAQGKFRGATDLATQSLWENETTAEGDDDYMNQITRDASYEEVLHIVQRRGIMNALPKFQEKIVAAHAAYAAAGKYNPDASHNVPNEYFAQQFDVYQDMWVIQPKKWEGRDLQPGEMVEGTAHWGANVANTRARLLEADPAAYHLVSNFFHPYLTYTPLLPLGFEGTFSIELDPRLVYTYKSQHLKSVTLRGSNNANLTGNAYNNILTGNNGDNVLKGGRGDDQLFGGDGNDTAVFSGAYEEYSIIKNDGHTTVRDKRVNQEGSDNLINIEYLQFSNRKVTL
jgi:hypothetical protein